MSNIQTYRKLEGSHIGETSIFASIRHDAIITSDVDIYRQATDNEGTAF